jgi:hypothetical protein
MMDRKDELMRKLSRDFDFGDPAVRVAFDRAHDLVSRRTIEYGEPPADAATLGGLMGVRENYPGMIPANSREEYVAHTREMQRLLVWDGEQDQTQDDVVKRINIMRQVGVARGYDKPTGVHDTRRFSFVENYRPQYLEHFNEHGESVLTPVLGSGQAVPVGGSKYANLASADADAPINYGGCRTVEESKFYNVPTAPTKPDGSIDYEKVMDWHRTPRPTGRQSSRFIPTGGK